MADLWKDPLLAFLLSETLDDPMDIGDISLLVEATSVVMVCATLVALRTVKEQSTVIENYVEGIVPFYSEMDFKAHFRMRRSTFEILCQRVAATLRHRTLTVEKKVLATLWVLSNEESFRGVADRFGLNKGTLRKVTLATCNSIAGLSPEEIKWPASRQVMAGIAEGFRELAGFPGVVGAIDGSHVPIPTPGSHGESYINRKGFASLQLQAICDHELKFLDVYVGWPGSVHDARVYRNSPVEQLINGLPEDYHILGDSAYPLNVNLLTPYRESGHLTDVEKLFNKRHSTTRVVIERAFGLLKCKFRRLRYLNMHCVSEMPVVVTAACVLHNVVLSCEALEDDVEVDAECSNQPFVGPGSTQPTAAGIKRDAISRQLV